MMRTTIPDINECRPTTNPRPGTLDDQEAASKVLTVHPPQAGSEEPGSEVCRWSHDPYNTFCPRRFASSSAFQKFPLSWGMSSRICWVDEPETQGLHGIFIGHNLSPFQDWVAVLALLAYCADVEFIISAKYQTARMKRTPTQVIYVKDEADQDKVLSWNGRLMLIADGDDVPMCGASKHMPHPGISLLVRQHGVLTTGEMLAFSALRESSRIRLPPGTLVIEKPDPSKVGKVKK